MLLLKDAVNVMFVANDTDDAVSASAEDIANGERMKKTAYMPPATHAVTRGKDVVHDDNDMISVGVYVYSKKKVLGRNFSFFFWLTCRHPFSIYQRRWPILGWHGLPEQFLRRHE